MKHLDTKISEYIKTEQERYRGLKVSQKIKKYGFWKTLLRECPSLPLYLSIIALVCATVLPLLRKIMA